MSILCPFCLCSTNNKRKTSVGIVGLSIAWPRRTRLIGRLWIIRLWFGIIIRWRIIWITHWIIHIRRRRVRSSSIGVIRRIIIHSITSRIREKENQLLGICGCFLIVLTSIGRSNTDLWRDQTPEKRYTVWPLIEMVFKSIIFCAISWLSNFTKAYRLLLLLIIFTSNGVPKISNLSMICSLVMSGGRLPRYTLHLWKELSQSWNRIL